MSATVMKEYTPIACSLYDFFEAAAVKGTAIRVDLGESDGKPLSREVRIVDLFARDHAEFMRARDLRSGEEFELRLDSVISITDLATQKIYSSRTC